ncbi:MAG: type II toxin-antitoxin system RelE/ParE family toxin [Terrimonas sp.]|nr:type II toxin-antitoxin system RelE/ParE family toxin [Terrimonas sp.]OJY94628.1 MAG: addiction module toxin RelE [Sphingobacteriales bacterium 40-81]
MEQHFIRNIYYYKDYYLDFFNELSPDVQKKFNWTLELIATIKQVPQKYFKHLEGTVGLYEIRVEYGGNIYRVFSFFDEEKLIIIANGFQKKTPKTPKNEIELAKKIKKEYFNEKIKK